MDDLLLPIQSTDMFANTLSQSQCLLVFDIFTTIYRWWEFMTQWPIGARILLWYEKLILNSNLVRPWYPFRLSICWKFCRVHSSDTAVLCAKFRNDWATGIISYRQTIFLDIWVQIEYSDVIISTMASQITGVSVVFSTFYSGAHQRKLQSSSSLDLLGESTGHRWIPLTKGQ